MNERERFHAVMNYGEVDRMPVYYFGTWPETKVRWRAEGLAAPVQEGSSGGPQLPEMDTDWECAPDNRGNIWDNQGLLEPWPRAPGKWETISEDAETRTSRSPLGGIVQNSKIGSSISHTLRYDLQPTRDDWERFKKFLDPADPGRWRPDWQERAAKLNAREHMTCFFGGSLYGKARDWLGVEALSCLAYDDPELFEEIIAFQTDYYIALNAPLLQQVAFDFAYFFEDNCFNTGPLISPAMHRQFYDRYYRKMIAAYRALGVPFMLIDSDGKVDDLLPCWLESGFDIVFPIEVGTWKGDPAAFRRQYGKRLRMIGGVNKHVIPLGEAAIRAELEPLRALAAEGGFIPMPDHRIPPDTSLEQFRTYLRVFKELFGRP